MEVSLWSVGPDRGGADRGLGGERGGGVYNTKLINNFTSICTTRDDYVHCTGKEKILKSYFIFKITEDLNMASFGKKLF